jgi:hypothetical protein
MAEDIQVRQRLTGILAEHPSRELLLQAFDQELEATEASAVQEHVRLCTLCESRWARLKALSEGVAAIESQIEVPPFQLRLPAGEPSPRADVNRLPVDRLVRVAALIAAAVALSVGLWMLTRNSSPREPAALARGGQGGASAGTRELVPKAPAEAKIAAPFLPSRNTAGFEGASARRRSALARVRPRVKPEPNSSPESGPVSASNTEEVFWALPYSNPALSPEGVHLVRVDLPREAFLMAGVPAAELPGASRESIAAEVLLGSDGLPSAIRPAHYRPASYGPPR